jgi:hypothetical protein
MTSAKQIAANRRNARRSTGPVTTQGKSRVSLNALRHGLSRRIPRPLEVTSNIEEYVVQLVGDDASQTGVDLANVAVDAQLVIVCIQRERRLLLERLISGSLDVGAVAVQGPEVVKRLASLDRYEQRAQGRRKKALKGLARLGRLPVFK